jgi:hypothetical protein
MWCDVMYMQMQCGISGGAVGIDVTPQRFVDPLIRERLDPVTDIPGLYMTGQDTVLCGVTLCQVKYEASVSVLCF